MARQADKPGTFRVRPKDGLYILSGVRANGQRVKVPGLDYAEAQRMGEQLCGAAPTIGQSVIAASPLALDDWGVPIVSADVVASTSPLPNLPGPTPTIGASANPSFSGYPKSVGATQAPSTSQTGPANDTGKRTKQAKSLMELAGVAWAAGDVWVGRKLAEKTGCDPVMPNQKQVNDLKDVTQETLTEMFGDKEVKPWQMMILLSIGIPISIVLQSPRSKKLKASSEESPSLKSVP